MNLKQIKTIDINAREWFDKINGNSYFAEELILNYGLKNALILKMGFQYGYGDHYQDIAFKEIKYLFKLDKKLYSLWRFCKDNKIILRTNKEENCLKRELSND